MTTDRAQRTRRLEPDARRQQILRCAVRLFGERPYASVSTTELAEAADVTRGLIHHYFGTKRGLYLEVVRSMLIVSEFAEVAPATGPLEERVDRAVGWLLNSIRPHARTFVAVSGAKGVGDDPEVEALLAEADDVAATQMLSIIGVPADATGAERRQAMIRAYGGLVKASMREVVRGGALSEADARAVLGATLLTIVRDVFPGAPTR